MTSRTTAPKPLAAASSPCLASYLTGAIGTAALLSAPQAEAAVTAVTFGFGPTLDRTDFSEFSTVGSFGKLRSTGYGIDGQYRMYLGTQSYSGEGFVYHDASRGSNFGVISFFPNGTVIGDSSPLDTEDAGVNGRRGEGSFEFKNSRFGSDQLNKNIGFRTNTGHWGWANVDWNTTAKVLTVNAAFVESVSGTPITINTSLLAAAPEPSRALLALAGMAGVALRRRRRQVA